MDDDERASATRGGKGKLKVGFDTYTDLSRCPDW